MATIMRVDENLLSHETITMLLQHFSVFASLLFTDK